MRNRLAPLFAVTAAVGVALGLVASLSPPAGATRNSSGTYSLPTGNPVVPGTTISSTWANSTLGDLSTELTDSLSRSGKGAMLAPLRLSAGSVAAPALSWDVDPDTGLYRVGAGSVAMSVDSTQMQRWQSGADAGTTITGTASISGATTLGGALSVTGATMLGGTVTGNPTVTIASADGGVGLQVTGGPANAAGVVATGGGTGDGIQGIGGAAGGQGVRGTGTATNSYGMVGTGNALGVGVEGVGGATGAGGLFRPGTAATASARTNALVAYNGDVTFAAYGAAPTNVNSTVAMSNTLTPKSLVKAWARIDTTGGGSTTATVVDGFNIASAASGSTNLTVNFASAFANTNYAILVTPTASVISCSGTYNTTTSIVVTCRDISGSTLPFPFHNFQTGLARTVYVLVVGAQ
ncbi:hypothetical protein D7X74_21305 [Corallococcus sp. CA047B]|uniref:hypothetical protein n=1 Tax=Corallococcus sp. CA047B TaxID=2316729 RepID=UPI000EA1BC96|nr:hypothetical protein [Corallococcus sp. CA047B]RKH13787.1 hypothetical protein D7X74_21305 [Corallococcus sp. CA047B]